jgi:hypothetical protein
MGEQLWRSADQQIARKTTILPTPRFVTLFTLKQCAQRRARSKVLVKRSSYRES